MFKVYNKDNRTTSLPLLFTSNIFYFELIVGQGLIGTIGVSLVSLLLLLNISQYMFPRVIRFKIYADYFVVMIDCAVKDLNFFMLYAEP